MTLQVGSVRMPRRWAVDRTTPCETRDDGGRVYLIHDLKDARLRRSGLCKVLRENASSPYEFFAAPWDPARSGFFNVSLGTGAVYDVLVWDIDVGAWVEDSYPEAELYAVGTDTEIDAAGLSLPHELYSNLRIGTVAVRYIDGDALPEDVAAVKRSFEIASI